MHLYAQVRTVSNFHLSLEHEPNACRLDVVLAYEVLTEQRAIMLYPINLLRNMARLQVGCGWSHCGGQPGGLPEVLDRA